MLFTIYSKNAGADTPVRPPTLHRTPCNPPVIAKPVTDVTGCGNPHPPSPAPLPKGAVTAKPCLGDSFLAPTAGHAGPALQSVALPGLGGQGRPPLRSSIGKRCVGADAYIGPPYRTPHRKKAAGFSPRRTTILMHRHFSSAAATNPQNSGCGLSGLLRNSGWN